MYRYTLNKDLKHEAKKAAKQPYTRASCLLEAARKYAQKYGQADHYHSSVALWKLLDSGSDFVYYSATKEDVVFINGYPFRSQMFERDEV